MNYYGNNYTPLASTINLDYRQGHEVLESTLIPLYKVEDPSLRILPLSLLLGNIGSTPTELEK